MRDPICVKTTAMVIHSTSIYHVPTKCQARAWTGVTVINEAEFVPTSMNLCALLQRTRSGRRHAQPELGVTAVEAGGLGNGRRTLGGVKGYFHFLLYTLYYLIF